MLKVKSTGTAIALAALTVVLVAAQLSVSARRDASAGTNTGPRFAVAEYNLGDAVFKDPGYPDRSELRAVVHYPRALAAGKYPLIVQLHGSWSPCITTDPEKMTWPCPPGVKPMPSFRGYDYLGEQLASRGYVVVSISANAINIGSMSGAYGARAHLINKHLEMWQQLSSSGSGPLTGKFTDPRSGKPLQLNFRGHVDLTNVGTMGHSRGGKAVMWQASDKHRAEWPTGVRVKAVVPLAPVYFDEVEGDISDGLVTRVPFAAITGPCDGAVGEGGIEYFDQVRGQNTGTVYRMSLQGANHNFFNTTWSPLGGLEGAENDSTCSPADTLTEPKQRQAATAYIVAFYERQLKGNTRFDPLLTGATSFPVPGVTADRKFRPPAR
jgi:hypothetical protein